MTATPAKLPGHPAKCRVCKTEIRWATTLATPNGPGGRAMPLDAYPNPDGNVAVRPITTRKLVARVLGKGENHDSFTEIRAMPHFATCVANQTDDLTTGVEALLAHAATSTEESR